MTESSLKKNVLKDISKLKEITDFIENYVELKKEYLGDISLSSDTDTEIIAHLIEHFLEDCTENAIFKTLSLLQGSYAVAIIDTFNKEMIYQFHAI